MDGVLRGSVFGSVLDLDTLNIELPPDVMIPGVAVASSRATPLAGTKSFCQRVFVGIVTCPWNRTFSGVCLIFVKTCRKHKPSGTGETPY